MGPSSAFPTAILVLAMRTSQLCNNLVGHILKSSPSFAQDPPRRKKLVERTLEEQTAEHARLTGHVDAAHTLLPPRQLLTLHEVEF